MTVIIQPAPGGGSVTIQPVEGPQGPAGPAGEGVPTGGTTGQILRKASDTDYDTEWAAVASGGTWGSITGTLSSQTDLQAALDGKAASSHTHTIANVTNLQTTLDTKVDEGAVTTSGLTMATDRLLGRDTSGTGAIEELTVGGGLSISGGSLSVSSSGGILSGTSFPVSPATGDRYYRTDRNIDYFYDGTRWLSTQIFTISLGDFDGIATNGTNYIAVPFKGVYSLYLLSFSASIFRNAAGEWDLALSRRAVDGTVTEIARRDGSGDTTNQHLCSVTNINAVLDSSANFLIFQALEISGASSMNGAGDLQYRLIG